MLAYWMDREESGWFIGKLTIPADEHKWCADFAIAYLEKFYGRNNKKKSLRKTKKSYPSPNNGYGYRWRKENDSATIDKFEAYLSTLTGVYDNEEQSKLTDILLQISWGTVKYLPNMFPQYLRRIERIEYIWTARNDNVFESWIIVDFQDVSEKERELHFSVVKERKEKFGHLNIKTFWDYIRHLRHLKLSSKK